MIGNHSGIYTQLLCTHSDLQCMWRYPLAFSPFADSPLLLFLSPPLLTWNPPCCDRIRQPWSQVAFKLTSPSLILPTPSPFQMPSTQVTVFIRLTTTTSRLRLLLSGTLLTQQYVVMLGVLTLSVSRHSGDFIPRIELTPLEIVFNKPHPSILLHVPEGTTRKVLILFLQEIKRDIIFRRAQLAEP